MGVRAPAIRAMQAGILALLAVGVLVANASIVVNAFLAFAVTLLPGVLERDYRVVLGRRLTFVVTAAVFLHTVGMVGLYSQLWWWDHLTHTLSAAVVASVGYASVRAFDEYSDAVRFTPNFLFAFTLLFTLALGVLWEVLEFGVRVTADALGMEPVLIQYSLGDTLVDLVFDIVGATIVAMFGARELAPTVEALSARLRGDDREEREHVDPER
jgi:hypothetical protein